jgi:hypothetical protein
MSEKTAVEQFAAEVLKYKNPTNLNGTDYVMIPINKLEYLREQAKEIEKEQMINFTHDFWFNYINQKDVIITEPREYYEKTYGDNK